MNERITPGQAFQLARLAADALQSSDVASAAAQDVIECQASVFGQGSVEIVRLGPDEAFRRLRGEQLERVLPFLGPPANSELLFVQQIARFMAVKAWREAGVGKGKYKDELWAAVRSFHYREDLAAIGLTELMLEDGRLRDQFLAEVAETYCYTGFERATNYQGITSPSGIVVIQAQWGGKYRNKRPFWCRQNFHPLEQGATIKEGLTGYLHFGKAWLSVCYKDLPGSVSEDGRVPDLYWRGEQAGLGADPGGHAGPGCGSVSRGK